MNAVTLFLNGLTSRKAALIFGCASVGLVAGITGGVIQYSRQKPVYEAHALLVPSPASLVGSASDWLRQESTAMLRQENLEEAARRVQMDTTRGIAPAECAALLRDSVRILIITTDGGPPELSDRSARGNPFQALQLVVRGENAAECAAAVSAITGVRESAWLDAERHRVASEPGLQAWRERGAELEQLRAKAQQLRTELVAGLPGAGIHRKAFSDSSLSGLAFNGNGLLSRVQSEWNDVREKADRVAAEVAAFPGSQLRPYAEYLEKPRPSATAVGPLWAENGWTWTLGGTAAGLLTGLLIWVFSGRGNVSAPHLVSPPAVEF